MSARQKHFRKVSVQRRSNSSLSSRKAIKCKNSGGRDARRPSYAVVDACARSHGRDAFVFRAGASGSCCRPCFFPTLGLTSEKGHCNHSVG
eukprot:2117481-Rhodomonas_salina.1